MTKEIFIKIHNRLMGEYLEVNPDADSAEVYNKTSAYWRLVNEISV